MMKFDIRAKLTFSFRPTAPQVELLIKLSKLHYDHSCRAASLERADRISTEGFLTRWKRSLELWDADPDVAITANFGELDLCTKLLEISPGLAPGEMAVQEDLANALHTVLRQANEVTKAWHTTVEIAQKPT